MQTSYETTKMYIFATQEQVRPYIGSMRLKLGGGHDYNRSDVHVNIGSER